MPSIQDVPLCTINTNTIRHYDTSVENLHSIWKVFSKCADSLHEGQRLENLSWRAFSRATSITAPTKPDLRPARSDIPNLSQSVESFTSGNSDLSEPSLSKPETAPLPIHPQPRQSSFTSSTSRYSRPATVSPLRLEKMVSSIQDESQPIAPLSPSIVKAVPSLQTPVEPEQQRLRDQSTHPSLRSSESSSSTAPMSSSGSDQSAVPTVGSDTSAELLSHHVIRGFSPNQTSSSYRSKIHLAPAAAPAKPIARNKDAQPQFMLGGSSGEDESSFEEHMPPHHPRQSSLTVGLKKPAKKQTSFRDELISKKPYEDEEVFVDSDEEDEEDSSAIDDETEDEDDENWEEASETEDISHDSRPQFQRVDSSSNLVSRRSLLTSQLHEGDRQAAFAEMAQAQAPSGLRKAKTQVRLNAPDGENLMMGPYMKRSKPISMASVNAQTAPIAFSPRTTRRNMLASEMTESLRKAVLFERQQKKATASAVKRRHTTQDLTSIRDYPETEATEQENRSWNDDYSTGAAADYNQAGW